MKKGNNNKYEAPRTQWLQVELGGLCNASPEIKNLGDDTGKIESHQGNTEFTSNFQLDDCDNWD